MQIPDTIPFTFKTLSLRFRIQAIAIARFTTFYSTLHTLRHLSPAKMTRLTNHLLLYLAAAFAVVQAQKGAPAGYCTSDSACACTICPDGKAATCQAAGIGQSSGYIPKPTPRWTKFQSIDLYNAGTANVLMVCPEPQKTTHHAKHPHPQLHRPQPAPPRRHFVHTPRQR